MPEKVFFGAEIAKLWRVSSLLESPLGRCSGTCACTMHSTKYMDSHEEGYIHYLILLTHDSLITILYPY